MFSSSKAFREIKSTLRPHFLSISKHWPTLVFFSLQILKFIFPWSTSVNSLLGYLYYIRKNQAQAAQSWDLVFSKIDPNGSWQHWVINYYIEVLANLGEKQKISRLLDSDLKKVLMNSYFFTNGSVISNMIRINAAENHEPFRKQIDHFLNKLDWKIIPIMSIQRASPGIIKVPTPHTFQFSTPVIWGDPPPVVREVPIPEQFVAPVENAVITGGFQVLKNQELVLYDPSGHPKFGMVAGVWRNFSHEKSLAADTVIAKNLKNYSTEIPTGILISGRATENYYHWLIEYLPKLYNIKYANIPENIPLIIQEKLPSQFLEALRCLVQNRKILEINPQISPVLVKNLYLPSQHTFHTEDFSVPFWLGSALSYPHLQFLRDGILEGLKIKPDDGIRNRKFFISRSGARNVKNSKLIEKMMLKMGFEIIRPETLTFSDQVHLFNKASFIVAPGGAALANLIFCQPGTKVICLISERNRDYGMHANLGYFSGCNYVNFPGPNVYSRDHYETEDEFVHSSYKINVRRLSECILKMQRTH